MRLSAEDLELTLNVTRDASLGVDLHTRIEAIGSTLETLVPGNVLTVIVLDPARPDLGVDAYMQGANPKGAELYTKHYVDHDPMPRRLLQAPAPLRLSDTVDGRSWGKDPYTGEFLPAEGIRHVLGFVATLPDGRRLQAGVHRVLGCDDFTDQEVCLFDLISADLTRAVGGALLRERIARIRDVLHPEDRLGILVFDAREDVEFADDGARSLVQRLGSDFPLEAVVTAARAARTGALVRVVPVVKEILRLSARAIEGGQESSVLVVLELVAPSQIPEPTALFDAFGFTPRERDVARQAALGLTNPQIAKTLNLRRSTVACHLSRVFNKAQVSGRTELARVLSQPRESR